MRELYNRPEIDTNYYAEYNASLEKRLINPDHGKILVIVGANATGKTTLASYAMEILLDHYYFEKDNLETFQRSILDDGAHLYEGVQKEHELREGEETIIEHTHTALLIGNTVPEKHNHNNGEPHVPFQITGNNPLVNMHRLTTEEYTQKLSEGRLHIGMLTLGKNINTEPPFSNLDLSSNTFVERANQGKYSLDWLTADNVLAVINTTASAHVREALDAEQKTEHIDAKLQSPQRGKIILDVFGEPDFRGSRLEEACMKAGIPLYSVENKGMYDRGFSKGKRIIKELLKPYIQYYLFGIKKLQPTKGVELSIEYPIQPAALTFQNIPLYTHPSTKKTGKIIRLSEAEVAAWNKAKFSF